MADERGAELARLRARVELLTLKNERLSRFVNALSSFSCATSFGKKNYCFKNHKCMTCHARDAGADVATIDEQLAKNAEATDA